MPIRILDAATVGRIAAGEVVERPASVAKELFENSLDAKATSITVEIRSGGMEYLRVTDNGCGIAPEEVRLAFQNHATSKLRTAEELTDIATMGFRGEALASVSAVSRVELTTRVRGAETGVKAVVEGGRFVSVDQSGCPEGTTVVVRDLFFNTPARKSFLKKPNYEAGAVVEAVTKLLLGNPGVSVRMINQGKTVFHSFGDNNLRHAALAVYGKDAASRLTDIDAMQGGLRLKGLIGVGDLARPTRSQQSFFVNGRSIRCPMLSQALENAAKGRVTIGMHPICALNVTMPANSVDVNVHPSKLEVRFRDEEAMRTSLDALLATAFGTQTMFDVDKAGEKPVGAEVKPKLCVETLEPANEKTPIKEDASRQTSAIKPPLAHAPEKSAEIAADIAIKPVTRTTLRDGADVRSLFSFESRENAVKEAPSAPAPLTKPPAAQSPKEEARPEMDNIGVEKPSYRVIGSAFDTYLLIQTDKALVMIDQHAAHERILYEKYSKRLNEGTASQKLLLPLVLEVSKKELAQIENSAEIISSAGFEVEVFGEREIVVRAVPFVLGKAEIRPLFMEMLDRLDQLKYAENDRRRQEIMQMSCKHAVKGSQALTQFEINDLIETMTKTEAPSTCPHGRPVLRAFSKQDLDKMFRRIQ